MTKSANKTSNVISAFATAVFGGFIFLNSRNLSAMGSVFPSTIAIALFVAAALLVATTLLRRPPPSNDDGQSTLVGAEAPETKLDYLRGLGLVGVMAIWLVTLRYFGLLMSSSVAFGALAFVIGYGKLSYNTLLIIWVCGVAAILGFTTLMTEVLMIPIPRGQVF